MYGEERNAEEEGGEGEWSIPVDLNGKKEGRGVEARGNLNVDSF